MPAHTSTDYQSATYYRAADTQAIRAMGITPGAVIATLPDNSVCILQPAGTLHHGVNSDGAALLADLIANSDVELLSTPVA
jgi:hypothetical protein